MTKEETQILLRAAVICKERGLEELSDELYRVLGLVKQVEDRPSP